jgi:DNA-binding winged helix-turn-helix (wHTH) protein/TolB-like protein
MPGAAPSEHLPTAAFLLAGLHVDPSTGVVRGPQGEVRLEPRVMAVLKALARRPGELVTRGELLTAIWPGGDVYDEALTQCVYQLRQQLVGVGGAECRDLVSTVPKRGYLLKAEVRPIAPAVEESATPPVRGHRRPFATGLLAAALVFIGAWAILEWRDGTDTPPVTPGTDIVAVLPFLPLVEESRDLALELGMADTLIARLSGTRQIVVRPISSVRRYANLERDALRAGRELGADAIVDGSIQRSEEGLRVTARLLRVADGAVLWADSLH